MKTRGTSSGLLLPLVLALVLLGHWTGWTEAILTWASGHLGDLIRNSVDQQVQ